MTVNDKIRDEKLQSNINREAAKISPSASRKIGKHEHLTGEQILQSYLSIFSFRKILRKTMNSG